MFRSDQAETSEHGWPLGVTSLQLRLCLTCPLKTPVCEAGGLFGSCHFLRASKSSHGFRINKQMHTEPSRIWKGLTTLISYKMTCRWFKRLKMHLVSWSKAISLVFLDKWVEVKEEANANNLSSSQKHIYTSTRLILNGWGRKYTLLKMGQPLWICSCTESLTATANQRCYSSHFAVNQTKALGSRVTGRGHSEFPTLSGLFLHNPLVLETVPFDLGESVDYSRAFENKTSCKLSQVDTVKMPAFFLNMFLLLYYKVLPWWAVPTLCPPGLMISGTLCTQKWGNQERSCSLLREFQSCPHWATAQTHHCSS